MPDVPCRVAHRYNPRLFFPRDVRQVSIVNILFTCIIAHIQTQIHLEKFKTSIERMEDYMQCLAPNCKSGQIHPGGDDEPLTTCADCVFQSCYKYKPPRHAGKTCTEYDYAASPERQKEEQATQKMLELTSKSCPNSNCGYRITKNGGCDHILSFPH